MNVLTDIDPSRQAVRAFQRAGGEPPSAAQRLLLDEVRKPMQKLVPGQRKRIQNRRVTLALGDEVQVATVRRIFHEFTETLRSLPEIARVLKPGGRVLISDVIADSLPSAVLEDLRFYSRYVAGALSEKAYRDGLAQAGFVSIEIRKRLELSLPQVEAPPESDRRAFERADRCCKEPGKAGVAAWGQCQF